MKKLLFLSVISCFMLISHVGVSQVHEINDPAYYSAGKLSKRTVNDWFKKNINPKDFDIWHAKKNRIYLNGAWKFKRIALPVQKVDTSPHAVSVNVRDSDYGEKHHFQDKNFDDSKWFIQPVPWAWIYQFKIPLFKKGEHYVKDGSPYSKKGRRVNLGWYRRTFSIPNSWKNERILLAFRAVTWNAKVYINGKLVGAHEESRKPIHWIAAKRTEEKFTFDITKYLSSGENTIAVKVFAPCPNGGIWQEVYLEARPEIYVKYALVTPELEKKSIRVKACVINESGKDVMVSPVLELGPWTSFRYNFAKGAIQKSNIAPWKLKKGVNELSFQAPVKNAQYWSPAHPYLYHMVIKDAKGRILGQERFGLRSFTVGKNNFLLNDKDIFLRSEDCFPHAWNYPGNVPSICGLGILNKDRMMEHTLQQYMNAGFNLMRVQSVYPTHIYFDIADEKGLLIYDEEHSAFMPDFGIKSMKDNKVTLSDKYKKAIKARCISSYNFPSYVMKSCQNEAFDPRSYDLPMLNKTGWAPLLSAIYEEYKKHDATRPITSSSGRGPMYTGFYYNSWLKAKADFDDCHPYVTTRWLKDSETDEFKRSFKKFKDAYTLDNNGKPRAMLDGESSEFYTFAQGTQKKALRNRQKDFLPHMKDGEFDRKWLAGNLSAIDRKYLSEACEYSLIPFNVSVDTDASCKVQAWHNRQIMELERRKRDVLAGYVIHVPVIFKHFSFGEAFPYTLEAAAKAQQAILPCLDGFFNKNMVAGNIEKTKLYLINDSEKELRNAKVGISLQADEKSAPVKLAEFSFDKVAVGGMAVKDIELKAPKLKTGHYKLLLEASDAKGKLSLNDCECYILNPSDITVKAPASPALVYAPEGYNPETVQKLSSILKKLGVNFNAIKSYAELKGRDGTLILPPYANTGKDDQKKLSAWIAGGGKMLAFAQKSIPTVLPNSRRGSIGEFGWWTELTMKKHPVFAGLNQDDFRFWAGKTPDGTRLVDNWILPLNEGVLAMGMSLNYRMGMSVCETRYGAGRCFFSQLKTIDRFEIDSVATKYTVNLMNYTLGGFDDPHAPELKNTDKKLSEYKVDAGKCFQVDLKKYVNMGFADSKAHDAKGGWSDQGPKNDASKLPVGKQTFAGAPFNIINPSSNNGKSCIVLQGIKHSKTEFLPLEIKNIQVRRKAEKLYFLVTSCWAYRKKPTVAFLRMNMNIKKGGTIQQNTLKLENGENIADWWNPPTVPNAIIGWRGIIKSNGTPRETGLYVVEWRNPEPNVEIGSIDFISAGWAVPILIAITGEE